MSQWVHVLGVVRYDSANMNVYPKPYNAESLLIKELEVVANIWSRNLPGGSEGPLQVNFTNTNRGPSVFITGDLRDFGKENLNEILGWANYCNEQVNNHFQKEKGWFFIRDIMIDCRVEYDSNKYLIEDDDDKEFFVLNVYKKEKGE